MIDRISSYIVSKPRRAAGIFLALIVALVLVLAGTLVALLDLGKASEPPYPSEDTPLSVVSDGIKYTREYNVSSDGEGLLYSDHWVCWQYDDGRSGSLVSSSLVQPQDQSYLGSGVEATVSYPLVAQYPWKDAPSLEVNVSVTDTTGDGVIGYGDYIMFENAPRTEDIVYTIGLVWLRSGASMYDEWSYAYHDGEFYAWRSSVLPSSYPWWNP